MTNVLNTARIGMSIILCAYAMNFEPGEYIRTMIFQSVTQAAQKKKI